jgi:hypothetical protein
MVSRDIEITPLIENILVLAYIEDNRIVKRTLFDTVIRVELEDRVYGEATFVLTLKGNPQYVICTVLDGVNSTSISLKTPENVQEHHITEPDYFMDVRNWFIAASKKSEVAEEQPCV